jgi:hypothetical protein
VLTTSSKTIQDFRTELEGWQTQGRLKDARVVEEADPVSLLERLIAEAHQSHRTDHAAFVTFLKSVKAQAEGLKLAALDEAKLPGDNEKNPLHYFAERFYLEKAIEALKERAAEVEKRSGKLLYGGPYAGSIGRKQNWDATILHAWRTKAFTAPWVADRSWQNGEFSPQVTGYYLALARSARTDVPIFCDLYLGSASNPLALRRSFYQALAHGSRAIRFVGATPVSTGRDAEWLPPARAETWKEIRELTHEAGRHESFFLDVKPRRSQIALLISLTAELWDPSLWVHEERKAIYHAARLSGHNIRILTEEDVQNGLPLDVSSIYIVGTHIQKRTAETLAEWVKANKSLGLVGGPIRDEYDQPLTGFYELMGITQASWENKQQAGAAKIVLPQIKPLDTVFWFYEGLKREIPVVYGKLSMTIDKKQEESIDAYGRFADKSPAVIRHVLPGTKVHLWTFGAPIGCGWFREALMFARPSARSPSSPELLIRSADGEMGDIVMAASGESRWDVITDKLEVESVLMESPRQMGLVCINWSKEAQNPLLTAQFLPGKYLHANSTAQGQLKTTRVGATLSFKVYVEKTDVITFEP